MIITVVGGPQDGRQYSHPGLPEFLLIIDEIGSGGLYVPMADGLDGHERWALPIFVENGKAMALWADREPAVPERDFPTDDN